MAISLKHCGLINRTRNYSGRNFTPPKVDLRIRSDRQEMIGTYKIDKR